MWKAPSQRPEHPEPFLVLRWVLAFLLTAVSAGIAGSTNIKESGAVGDGVADDTPAIQRALDGGNRTVVIPKGLYRITAALKVDSGTTIQADGQAVIRLGDGAGNNVGVFLLTNRDYSAGDADIVVDGGIWDGNNEHNVRGVKTQMPCYTGVALNFINVRHLTLRNLTVRNPDAYAIRVCHLTDFVIENIGFDFSVVRENQDGVHINGFCVHGVIRNVRALSPYATNDDMVALNADDGAGTDYAIQQGMEPGPIRDITVEHLRADSAFTFVRVLSHRQPIENVTVSDVAGGCRFYAINMDRWKFPVGGGNIRNVVLRDFNVRKMPDTFSRQAHPNQRPLIHIQTAARGLQIQNFQRGEGDEASASTLVLDTGVKNHLRLEGLNEGQIKAVSGVSPEMIVNGKVVEMNANRKVTLPAGGFSLLKLDVETSAGAAKAAD